MKLLKNAVGFSCYSIKFTISARLRQAIKDWLSSSSLNFIWNVLILYMVSKLVDSVPKLFYKY